MRLGRWARPLGQAVRQRQETNTPSVETALLHLVKLVPKLITRFLAMASSKGHVATFDWQAGKLNAEIQLREPVRDIK